MSLNIKQKEKIIKASVFTKTIKILLVNLIVFLILFELGSRSFLSLRRDASFFDPSSVTLFYYPEMKSTLAQPPSAENWDILLLGASVLNPAWGKVEKELKELLSQFGKNIVIHNLAIPAHTTRDSLIKYRLLRDYKFDKVFVYHGINELRMNNYPLYHYRQDYSHIHWYRTVNLFSLHSELSYIATPFFLKHAWTKITCPDNDEQYEDKQHGDNLKTAEAFYDNLSKISELASQKDEDLILATYAFHLPDDYNIDAFESKSLSYNGHRLPVEAWGLPKHVQHGLLVHNDKISQIAAEKKLTCVKINKKIVGEATNFDDICHLTSEGSRLFAEILVPHLSPNHSLND